MKSHLFLFMLLANICCLQQATAQTWLPKGIDINGEANYDQSGWSVSMPDANTIAIGAHHNGGNGQFAGHVRIYAWNGNSWIQKGADIDGEAANDQSAWSISMPDANTVAIGARYNSGNNINAGHVRIYSWNGSSWVQKGADIDGEAANDQSACSISMPDANTVAIGAIHNDGNGTSAGHIRVYTWTGNNWTQKGGDIDGEVSGDESGFSVSMPDANTVAIGAIYNDGSDTSAGHIRVYTWTGNNWTQKGVDIDGESSYDRSGFSVDMPDANTVAIGAHLNEGNSINAGHVRVYAWNGSNWAQKGTDIDGEGASDESGSSVSMPDANTVAIGAPYNGGNGSNAGHVRIYVWSGTNWTQLGADIDGTATWDICGSSVSMPDVNTVAVGAPYGDGNGIDDGYVRVYQLSTVGVLENKLSDLAIYPNPSDGNFNVLCPYSENGYQVTVHDALGQIVYESKINAANLRPGENVINLPLNTFARGTYYLTLSNGNNQPAHKKLMIQ
jgi:hypothetical protein